MTGSPQDDDDDDDAGAGLPAGVKNYLTPPGYRALLQELDHLWHVERPKVVEVVSWAAGNGDRSENGDYLYGKKKLREIDRRVRFLRKRLDRSEVVDPSRQTNRSRVYFGATVTYAEEDGTEHTIAIVGVDEADIEKGKVSWISPVARALMKAEVGDTVIIRSPAGKREVEIVDIRYPEAS
jgi:transcription elongation factor GreB